jgi:hypothetical protein
MAGASPEERVWMIWQHIALLADGLPSLEMEVAAYERDSDSNEELKSDGSAQLLPASSLDKLNRPVDV